MVNEIKISFGEFRMISTAPLKLINLRGLRSRLILFSGMSFAIGRMVLGLRPLHDGRFMYTKPGFPSHD